LHAKRKRAATHGGSLRAEEHPMWGLQWFKGILRADFAINGALGAPLI